MHPEPDAGSWGLLEANAHRPEVQERIGRAIRAGTIRVVPTREGGIRILPDGAPEDGRLPAPPAPFAPPAGSMPQPGIRAEDLRPIRLGAIRSRMTARCGGG
jgi:hypothetical protein